MWGRLVVLVANALARAHVPRACCAFGAGGTRPRLVLSGVLAAGGTVFGCAAQCEDPRSSPTAVAALGQPPPKVGLILAGALLGAVLSAEQMDAECAPKKQEEGRRAPVLGGEPCAP